MRKTLISVILLLFLFTLVAVHIGRPRAQSSSRTLFAGVHYRRERRTSPRPIMLHVVTIDLATAGATLLVTPGDDSQGREVRASTTSAFAERFNVQLAINGSYFYPFSAGNLLLSGYPSSGDPVFVDGLAISNGAAYSPAQRNRPVLCVFEATVAIERQTCRDDARQALSGNQILVWDGAAYSWNNRDLHPRTAVAIDASGQRLWLIVVDGRQPFYSEGMTFGELADVAQQLGAERAVNLDGGGSTTLVLRQGGRTQILNAPIHRRIPMLQRPVANHLGLFVNP